jgi:hypothetical protein
MDHLPHGDYSKPFKIPYICKEPYSHGGEWLAYPASQGFNLDHLRVHAFYHYPPDTVAQFLQSWLYFGLLFATLPFKPDIDNFLIDDEESGKCVTTSKLPMYLERWRQHAASLSEEQKLSLWRKNISTLEDAHRTILSIGNWPHNGIPLNMSPIPPVSREMSLSFALLGRALELANNEILNPEARANFRGWYGGWSSGSLLLEHMENLGWCPFLIAGIEHSFGIDGKYFASTIGPPRVKRNHRTCTDKMCMYRSSGIQHVTPMCQCLMFSPDIDKLGKILAEGKLPLLRFVTDFGGKGRKLEVVPGEAGTKYIAMSHVWSDGLGNFKANEIPACQLGRIQTAVDSLYHDCSIIDDSNVPSMPFWMDTLLIPNDPKLKEIKDATIINMTQIYKHARAVLVIDSEVATCSLTSDSLSVLYRILLSNWMRRLWTLQEGVFADSIHFLLSDGTKSLRTLISGEGDGIGVGMKAGLRAYLTYRFERGLGQTSSPVVIGPQDSNNTRDGHSENATIRAIRAVTERVSTSLCFEHCLERNANPKDPEVLSEDPFAMELALPAERQAWLSWSCESAIIRTVRAVADRVSTFASDEALCLALLLDVNAESIIAAKNRLNSWEELERAHPEYFLSPQAKYEKRKLENQPMLLLLELLDGLIPPGIILLPGPHQDTYGFRWAPKSFLNEPANSQEIEGFPNSIPQEYPSKEYLVRLPSSLCRHGGGGLRVMFPGVRLKEMKENCYLEKMFVIDTLPSLDLNTKEENVEGKPPRIWKVLYRDDPDDPPWADVQPNWQNSMSIGIIICSYAQSWQDNPLTGLMVRIKGEVVEDDEVKSIHVERICRVIISGAPEYDNQYWVKGPEKRVSGSWLPMTQQWCVD